MRVKNLLIILVLSFISCSSKDSIVLFDEYYSSFNNTNQNGMVELQYVNLSELNISEYFSYKNILISPLLYKLYSEDWEGYLGKLYVLDPLFRKDNDTYKGILINDSKSYSDLINYINEVGNVDYKKITVIIDYDTDLKIEDVDIIKKVNNNSDLNFLLVTQDISRSKVSNFIKNNKNTDLWIIDSKKYGIYGYNLIKDGSILLYNGENIQKGNSHIKFSIEADISEYLNGIFKDERDFIFSKLKIY